ncbi:MAG: TIGR02453 family protein [Flavobacteriaceae bacterium]|nr:TIGR02453 family protein [Flavobacteriaceae bacterium]
MSKINPDVITFYKELSENNTREWFEPQKKRFKSLELEIKQYADEIKNNLNETDEIEHAKIFRIYRDVRFSKNKTPFKTHFGISFYRKKPDLRGGYYIHISPGDSFIATGFWNPDKDDLYRIRKEMEVDAKEFREIINEDDFKFHWGNLQGEEVKTAPKGFSKEHPDIDIIRKKQFLFIKKFTDKDVLARNFSEQIITKFKAIRPFFDHMTSILTTDLNGVSLL